MDSVEFLRMYLASVPVDVARVSYFPSISISSWVHMAVKSHRRYTPKRTVQAHPPLEDSDIPRSQHRAEAGINPCLVCESPGFLGT